MDLDRITHLHSSLTYLGAYDSSYQYSKGDIVVKDGMTQCFDGKKYQI